MPSYSDKALTQLVATSVVGHMLDKYHISRFVQNEKKQTANEVSCLFNWVKRA